MAIYTRKGHFCKSTYWLWGVATSLQKK